MKEIVLYQEKFKKRSLFMKPDTFEHFEKAFAENGAKVTEVEVKSMGTVQRGDDKLEFTDMRVYLKT